MGNITGWIDQGTHLRVWIDIPLRKNGLPNLAAARAVVGYLEQFQPDAFDPQEPVPESVARAFQQHIEKIEHVEVSAESPPVPVFEGDDIPGPRCGNGLCLGD